MIVAGLTVLGLSVVGTPAPGSPPERAGSLKVTPSVYVAGQNMTFSGSLGGGGSKPIRLQFHMNRPGDVWTNVVGFGSRTDASGKFRFNYPAPAMWGISYRVVSGRQATSAHLFRARSQEVVLSVGNDDTALAGDPFTVEVDTTPTLPGRQDLPPPVIQGRTVTLQKRVNGNRWQTITTALTDSSGMARFPQTVNEPGVVVYRAREEDWTKNGDRIGWFPSFPTYVEILASPRPTPRVASSQVSAAWPSVAAERSPNASSNYGWGATIYDFAWEYGESLTSKPFKGTNRRGRWIDVSDGTGRASHTNGGLGLDSQQKASGGPGDRGTTSVTLKGNPRKYGRWEVRLRSWSRESSAEDYHVKIELVPDRAADYRCGAQNITVADYAIHTPAVRFGVNTLSNRRWFSSKGKVALADVSHNFAVEVAKDHITWYLDGAPIGTVKSRAAVSDVPLTLRLSLQGKGTTTEMNRTRSIYDWMRAWPIDTGRRVTNGPRMRTDTNAPSC